MLMRARLVISRLVTYSDGLSGADAGGGGSGGIRTAMMASATTASAWRSSAGSGGSRKAQLVDNDGDFAAWQRHASLCGRRLCLRISMCSMIRAASGGKSQVAALTLALHSALVGRSANAIASI